MTADCRPSERRESEVASSDSPSRTEDRHKDGDHTYARHADDATDSVSTKDSRMRRSMRLQTTECLEDFHPEQSTLQRRKPTQKTYGKTYSRSTLDEHGRYRSSGADACDCLITSCAGCHFPCPSCGSTKCGLECRVNRKWVVDSIEYDGKDLFHENPNIARNYE